MVSMLQIITQVLYAPLFIGTKEPLPRKVGFPSAFLTKTHLELEQLSPWARPY
jgi:hypothetical protein